MAARTTRVLHARGHGWFFYASPWIKNPWTMCGHSGDLVLGDEKPTCKRCRRMLGLSGRQRKGGR